MEYDSTYYLFEDDFTVDEEELELSLMEHEEVEDLMATLMI